MNTLYPMPVTIEQVAAVIRKDGRQRRCLVLDETA
jgi:hypothetical protein